MPNVNAVDDNVVLGNAMVAGASRVVICDATLNSVGMPHRKSNHGSVWTSGLPSDIKLCLGNGNDQLRVLRQSETFVCGGLTMTALAYGVTPTTQKRLIVGGGNGSDTVIGGDGVDVADFSQGVTFSGTTDRAATGRGADIVIAAPRGTTLAWGGSGNDGYLAQVGAAGNIPNFFVQDLSGLDTYIGVAGSIDQFCDVPDVLGGTPSATPNIMCGNDVGDRQNAQIGNANCPWNFVCNVMPPIPATDV
jgi:hypothetical protein